jgi:hypothetical protein
MLAVAANVKDDGAGNDILLNIIQVGSNVHHATQSNDKSCSAEAHLEAPRRCAGARDTMELCGSRDVKK